MNCNAMLLLLLLLPAAMASWSSAYARCRKSTPVCKSDRFDIVLSRIDESSCKVYECKCRSPQLPACAGKAKPKLKTDRFGCKYYECIACPLRRPCIGSMVSKYKGDDENGCPTYRCQCDPNPSKPSCASNEKLQQISDKAGCLQYQCKQFRSACPSRPSCSSNQELVSSGKVGDCRIYKCVCLTPAEPACRVGTQPRLTDDGLGCQEYQCVANRSPCPAEPTCPSAHQIVSQTGVDANNCLQYDCTCMPLAELTCPDGFVRTLETDSPYGCQFYKCSPDCNPKPNCTSVYRRAVVMATLSNGCPSYTCRCKTPEVINCVASDAHLELAKATDGSNCDVYVCITGDTDARSCTVPRCANPVQTGSTDSSGCPIYSCSSCPSAPTCLNSGEQLKLAGSDSSGCPQYVCHRVGCPELSECSSGQLAVASRYAGVCPVYACVTSLSCAPVPTCSTGYTAKQIGYFSNNCPQYICQQIACTKPTVCNAGQPASQSIDASGCVSVKCGSSARSCSAAPECSGGSPVALGVDANGCTKYVCQPSACTSIVPSCSTNQQLTVTAYTSAGCPVYACVSAKVRCGLPPQCRADEKLSIISYSGSCPVFECKPAAVCPSAPNCTNGAAAKVTGNDASGCAVYACPVCGSAPVCSAGQKVEFTGTDSVGCAVFACKRVAVVCTAPSVCSDGRPPRVVGTDSSDCPIYDSCRSSTRSSEEDEDVRRRKRRREERKTRRKTKSKTHPSSSASSASTSSTTTTSSSSSSSSSSSCPKPPDCQQKQFRMRHKEARNGVECDVFNCINLGDYTGRPGKCADNPSFCDISETVETYFDRSRRCQRISCKGSIDFDNFDFAF